MSDRTAKTFEALGVMIFVCILAFIALGTLAQIVAYIRWILHLNVLIFLKEWAIGHVLEIALVGITAVTGLVMTRRRKQK